MPQPHQPSNLSSVPVEADETDTIPSSLITALRLRAWLGRIGVHTPARRWAASALALLVAGLVTLAWATFATKKPVASMLPDTPGAAATSAGPTAAIPLAIKGPTEIVEPAASPIVATPSSNIAAPAGPLPASSPALLAEVQPSAAQPLPASPVPAVTPGPVQAAVQAAASTLASDLKHLLEQQQRHAERLEQLEQQLDRHLATVTAQLTRLQAQRSAAARATRHAAAPAVPASAPASAPVPAQARLLSVDVWDGKASVVIGSDAAGDRRVRFLSEGDRQSDIAVKQASPQDQRAVFDVAGREVVLERGSNR